MRNELTRVASLLEKYVGSNEQIIIKMQDNISEVKTQIAEIKSTNEQTENFIQDNITEVKSQINDIKSSTSNIMLEQNSIKSRFSDLENKISTGETKLKSLESNFEKMKPSCVATPTTVFENQLHLNEKLVREVKERNEREKNIILVGLPEPNFPSAEERMAKDESDIFETTRSVSKDIPKPVKVVRIGKFSADKNRAIKVCYGTLGPAKQLLRNKEKLPDGVKIYSDQTLMQQKYLQDLKDELARRLRNGETDLTIKYTNGVPSIIKITPPKNSQQ